MSDDATLENPIGGNEGVKMMSVEGGVPQNQDSEAKNADDETVDRPSHW